MKRKLFQSFEKAIYQKHSFLLSYKQQYPRLPFPVLTRNSCKCSSPYSPVNVIFNAIVEFSKTRCRMKRAKQPQNHCSGFEYLLPKIVFSYGYNPCTCSRKSC